MKIQAAVIFGGRSVEHEVSIISAMQVIAALDKEKYEAVALYIAKDGAMYSGEEFLRLESYRSLPGLLQPGKQVSVVRSGSRVLLQPNTKKLFGAEKPMPIDIAIPVAHGTFVEDGSLQGFLELLILPYTGCDVLSGAICMDKPAAKALLRGQGLPVLPDYVGHKCDFEESQDVMAGAIEALLPYPVIVKPANLGSSVGITKAANRERLKSALELAFTFAEQVLVEPMVQSLREINVSILGSGREARASVCEEPIGSDEILSYQDKYQRGGKSTKGPKTGGGMSSAQRVIPADLPAELTQQVQELGRKAFLALGCNGVARVDFLLDGETGALYINELNTLPGSMAFYLWEHSGLSFTALLDELIAGAFARHRARANLQFSFETNLLANASLGGVKKR